MRTVSPRHVAAGDLRRRLDRLGDLPLRTTTARLVLDETPDDLADARLSPADSARWAAVSSLDPGWVLESLRLREAREPLALVACCAWWPTTSREGTDALSHLWRHSVAVGLAARRLAREANDPEADRLAKVGFLNGLGTWAVAAIEPEAFALWLGLDSPLTRREYERKTFGSDFGSIGRGLAERWECDPLLSDAAWLLVENPKGLHLASDEPARLQILQAAYLLAEQTPWALAPGSSREALSPNPLVRLLIAEVQSRCGLPFAAGTKDSREETLTRSNASLRLRIAALTAGQDSRDRLIQTMVEWNPAESRESWTERAALAFCAEPGISSARVAWSDEDDPPSPAPTWVVPLQSRGRRYASAFLWASDDPEDTLSLPGPTLAAWGVWARIVDDRARSEVRLARVVEAFRDSIGSEEIRMRTAKLDAMAEFAAGAGHELNNPLAVIVGRAQLLLVKEKDPKAQRSLRAILTQAQRAHRILRDLIYVARPPDARPRFCSPEEIVRSSVRDARGDADEREVKLAVDPIDPGVRAWADPDALRHLADSLLRNAVESTPRGGHVRFSTGGDVSTVRWMIHDSGRGITPTEGAHLFDPFYCGRQAGRGLGLGLSRASRFVAMQGGEIRWQSSPGQGATFQVRLPLPAAPKPPALAGDANAADEPRLAPPTA